MMRFETVSLGKNRRLILKASRLILGKNKRLMAKSGVTGQATLKNVCDIWELFVWYELEMWMLPPFMYILFHLGNTGGAVCQQ
ncbi:MAG: hypothetical protein LBH04_03305 [Tannerellaceae bacterium]|jgi:hypothetical protein|nr:hypothetical protein [Tannerellaceae bacterium]